MSDSIRALRAIFDAASEMADPGERSAFVERSCAGDEAMRLEVEDLLRSLETAGGFLGESGIRAGDSVLLMQNEGDELGRYRLVKRLGEGGCGVVFLAEQTEPVRRRVALKVIKLGMDTRSVIARFEAERQALAMMDHPGIARVLDAGATSAGRPYFVMELVEGKRITEYCAEHQLSTGDRLRLFIQVCQAVQHAHQKGIIHRDIKPSNILVASGDGGPLPKVIDFGIAKATSDVRLTDETVRTQFEMFLGTPAYMSPEQAEGGAADLDTRTDIYSLGVLLYELLTGRPPFDTETWLKAGVEAMRRGIRETEPVRPSVRVTRDWERARRGIHGEAEGETDSVRRATGLAKASDGGGKPLVFGMEIGRVQALIGDLRGDLDWIVIKALEKDRTRRYETAAEFAADVQRHLDHQPVVARPPNPIYLFRKLVRRNRSAFAVGVALALMLLAGAFFSVRDAIRTRGAEKTQRELRERAEKAKSEADAANRELRQSLFVREWLDAELLLDQGKTAPAIAWLSKAARERPEDRSVQTRVLALLTDRSFAIQVGRPMVHGAPINSAEFLGDGIHLATAGADGAVRIWALKSDAAPRELEARFENPSVGVTAQRGRWIVEEQRSLSLWDANGVQIRATPHEHLAMGRLAMSADHRLAAIMGADRAVWLWDVDRLESTGRRLDGVSLFPAKYVFAGGDRYFLAYDSTGRLAAWDTTTSRVVWRLPDGALRGQGAVFWGLIPGRRSVLVSSWVSAAGGELSEWTFEPGESDAGPAIARMVDASIPTRSIVTQWCYSEDGRRAYLADVEGHLWSFDLGSRELRPLNGEHGGRVMWMSPLPNEPLLGTASIDGTVRLWDVRMKQQPAIVATNLPSVWDAQFSPDSRWIASGGGGAVEILDARSASVIRRLPLAHLITRVDISSDGRRVAACGNGGEVGAWDVASGDPLFPVLRGGPSHLVKFSKDGGWFWVVRYVESIGKAITLRFESESGRPIGVPMTNSTQVVDARMSPDDRWFAAGCDNGVVEFWSVEQGRRAPIESRHQDVVWTVRFSSDGTRCLTSSRDRTAAVWETGTWKRLVELPHEQQVYTAEFSPDGRRIVTGDASRRAHVWDASSGRRLFSLPAHPGGVWYGEFSADGGRILTGDDTGKTRVWDASNGLALADWVHNGVSLRRAHFSPDGRLALSAAENGTLRVWPVLTAPLPAPAWLPELAEALAGRRLRSDGSLELLPAERRQELIDSLKNVSGNDFYARWARWFLIERMQDQPSAFHP